MGDVTVTKIAAGVFLGIALFITLSSALAQIGDTKTASLRTAEAVEKIAAECVVERREP